VAKKKIVSKSDLKFDNRTLYRIREDSEVGDGFKGRNGLLVNLGWGIYPIAIQFYNGTVLPCEIEDVRQVTADDQPWLTKTMDLDPLVCNFVTAMAKIVSHGTDCIINVEGVGRFRILPSTGEENELVPTEVGAAYNRKGDRFLVSIVSSYGNDLDGAKTPKDAINALMQLITGEDQGRTLWHVYDRETKKMYQIKQGEMERRLGYSHL